MMKIGVRPGFAPCSLSSQPSILLNRTDSPCCLKVVRDSRVELPDNRHT